MVAVYLTEAYSETARREIRKHASIPWTPLHDLEVRNAFRLSVGRRQIAEDELTALLRHIDEDLDKGRLVRPATDLGAIFRRAGELSQRHATKMLARTLDILHVAALQELGCETLVSGDERQITLAVSKGLEVVDIRTDA